MEEQKQIIEEKRQKQILEQYKVLCIIFYIFVCFLFYLNIKYLYECKTENYQELNNKYITLKTQNEKLKEEYNSILDQRYMYIRLLEQTNDIYFY